MTHSATSLTCLCWLLVPLALACLLLACLALLPGLSEEYLTGSVLPQISKPYPENRHEKATKKGVW